MITPQAKDSWVVRCDTPQCGSSLLVHAVDHHAAAERAFDAYHWATMPNGKMACRQHKGAA